MPSLNEVVLHNDTFIYGLNFLQNFQGNEIYKLSCFKVELFWTVQWRGEYSGL